jgi:hypothetical protein
MRRFRFDTTLFPEDRDQAGRFGGRLGGRYRARRRGRGERGHLHRAGLGNGKLVQRMK